MPTTAIAQTNAEHGVVLAIWQAVPNGNDGAPFKSGRFADKCVQVAGTLGAGGSVLIEGSNDGATYFQLNGPTKGALVFAALGGDQIIENPLYIRPRVTAGDGTTALTITLLARGES